VPPAAFGGRKVRALLRVLALRRPDLLPHDALADALWPDLADAVTQMMRPPADRLEPTGALQRTTPLGGSRSMIRPDSRPTP
jgi:hypothetical protein